MERLNTRIVDGIEAPNWAKFVSKFIGTLYFEEYEEQIIDAKYKAVAVESKTNVYSRGDNFGVVIYSLPEYKAFKGNLE